MKSAPVFAVPVDDLHPDPKNPRSRLGDLEDLVASIRVRGVLQPVLATRSHGGRLVILAGHRRVAAAKEAGLTEVPTMVLRDDTFHGQDRLTAALAENLHRAELSPMDEARAVLALQDLGYPLGRIARELSRSTSWVSDRLALLSLTRDVQTAVDCGQMPIGNAVELGRQIRNTGRGAVTVGAKAPQHLIRSHPLAKAAKVRCDEAGHADRGRITVACGRCWEAEIRADEQRLTVPPTDPSRRN